MKQRSTPLVELARIALLKLLKRYHTLHGTRMPMILVTGTAGKSSQTLMLRTMFEEAGWFVFSGTSQKSAAYNSIAGLIMVIAGFHIDLKHGFKPAKKVWFVIRMLWFIIFESYSKINQKTILIYEVGYDHQDESAQFARVFDSGFDLLVTTSITYEHTGGFTDILNTPLLARINSRLPEDYLAMFEDEGVDTRLKNIALEQFRLIEYADDYIIPAAVGSIDNWVIDSIDGELTTYYVESKRGKNFVLEADNMYEFSADYILPHTFASTAYMLARVAHKYNIDNEYVHHTTRNIALPNGRFSLLEGLCKSVIVDSSYNSDPQSLDSLIDLIDEVIEVSTTVEDKHFLSTELDARSSEVPKHYLIFGEMRELGDTATLAHQEILERIIELGKNKGPYIENIYLVGNEWLKCDNDGVVKVQNNVSFISFQNQLFKVFAKAGDVTTLLNPDTIRPNSWFWIKGSQNTIFLEIVVEHLLAHKDDVERLTRRGASWDKARAPWK